jgi:hypothetical protein
MKLVVFLKPFPAKPSKPLYKPGAALHLADALADKLIGEGYAVERAEPQIETKTK